MVRFATFKEGGFKMLLQGGEVVNEGTYLSTNTERRSQNSQLLRGLEGRAVNALNKFGQTVKYNLGTYRSVPIMSDKISLDPLLGKRIMLSPQKILKCVGLVVLLIFLGIETYSPVLRHN
jgi:hypothetical protein